MTQPWRAGGQELAGGQESQPEPQPESQPGREKFQQRISEWQSTICEINAVKIRYRNSKPPETAKLRVQHRELETKGREQFEAAFDEAIKVVKAEQVADSDATLFLAFATNYRYSRDIYEKTGEAAETLLEIIDNDRGLPEIAGVSFFVTGQLEKARPFLEQAVAMGLLDEKNRGLLPAIDVMIPVWEAENNQLKIDAEKGDLPQVKLETTRGDVILELFEDQAPNTVANFITLVEEGALRGIPFYQVVTAEVVLAGDTRINSESLAFVIPDEGNLPDARPMLRGYACMAKLPMPEGGSMATIPNSASSHFFISLRPRYDQSKEQTVFGRIVQGMSHLSVLTRVDPNEKLEEGEKPPEPDMILSAEVIRRRKQDYTPNRIDTATGRSTAGGQQVDPNP